MATRRMTPAPRAVGASANLIAFTAANPTVATAEDASTLTLGETVTLAAVAGDPAAMTAIDGASATIDALAGNDVTLALDLSAVDVTGLAATATVSAEAPAPSPPPSPSPPPDEAVIAAAQLLTRYPSPGVGVMPVDVGTDDLPPGMRSIDDEVRNPEDPLGPPLEGAARADYIEAWRAKRRGPMDDLRKVGQALI